MVQIQPSASSLTMYENTGAPLCIGPDQDEAQYRYLDPDSIVCLTDMCISWHFISKYYYFSRFTLSINNRMSEYIWKTLALRELLAFRILFLLHMIWDFFLTVSIPSSMRSRALLDFGASFSPIIIILWITTIIGLIILLFIDAIRKAGIRQDETTVMANYLVLICAMILYSMLFFTSLMNILILWPIVASFGTGLLWAGILLYFRYKHRRRGS